MEIKSIQTKKIYKNIVEQIINLIKDGSLKPGDKLPPERNLSEMLNVSRASLREALSVMEIIGIIDIRPGEGSFVSDLNIQPFISLMIPIILKDSAVENDLLEFRKLLEIATVKSVTEKLKGDEPIISILKSIVEEMAEVFDDPERSAYLDTMFHKHIFLLSGNNILVTVLTYLEYILEQTVRFNRNHILNGVETPKILYMQHKAVLDAILLKDGELAAEKMQAHLNYVNSFL